MDESCPFERGQNGVGKGARDPLSERLIAIVLPDLRGGGAERVGINLANEFAAQGHRVDLVLLRAVGELLPLLDSRVCIVDLGVVRLRGLFVPLLRYLRKVRPSALLASMWPITVISAAACRLSGYGPRLVVVEHTDWSSSRERGGPARRIAMKCTMALGFRLANGVVAVSDGASDVLARVGWYPRNRITTIHNPIVGGAESRQVSGVGVAPCWSTGDHHRILAVGSLKAVKDYPTLLRAFRILLRSTDAKLLILGEGEERQPLQRLVAELGLGDDVTMPGFTVTTETFYKAADLHVLSSTAEGFGNVLVEAMAQGTPVVSTDCPSGPREILMDGRYGPLVPVGDAERLAEAMLGSLSYPQDRAALQARAKHFSVERAAEAYLSLLLPDACGKNPEVSI
ncbi:glycosyltransferase [Luteimonas sp. MC1825]|uniref:glycosyltransferase n=1 Tax=Luteimonas sp. MC1825 TaxID=2761107 RepID=UPI001CC53B5D|nr:glycosyltransferase [Luteimonas sp. MC1825]